MNIIPNIAYQYRRDIERKRKKYIFQTEERKKTYTNTCNSKEEREKIYTSQWREEREKKKLQKVTAQVDQYTE